MESELRKSYGEMAGAARGALEALVPPKRRRLRRRQEIAERLQAQLKDSPEGEVARYLSSLGRDARGLGAPGQEAPGEHP